MSDTPVKHLMENWTICPLGHVTVSPKRCIRTGEHRPLSRSSPMCGREVVLVRDVPAVEATIRLHDVINEEDHERHERALAVMLYDLQVFK